MTSPINPHDMARIRINQAVTAIKDNRVVSSSDLRGIKAVLEDSDYAIRTSVAQLYEYQEENTNLKAHIQELERQLESQHQTRDLLRVALDESLKEKRDIAEQFHAWLDLSSLHHSEAMYPKGDLISAFGLISVAHNRLLSLQATPHNGFVAYRTWLNETIKQIIREEKENG